jgi:LmbE family N-acetylglucosaminyl deacetylase
MSNALSSSTLRILGIFAHPDDPEFSMGGSAALWADQGHEVYYCIVTDGSAGSNDPNQDLRELVRIREEEQRAAARVLGVREVFFLGYKDGVLEPTLELRRELTRLIRHLKPDRVVCGDPTAFFYGDEYINHADHRAAAEAAVTAVFPSAPTRPIFPELLAEGLEPHQVKELYITADQADHIRSTWTFPPRSNARSKPCAATPVRCRSAMEIGCAIGRQKPAKPPV